MKHFLIFLSALVLAQCLTAEESYPFGKDAEELLVPLLKEFHQLKQLVDEVKQYQKTQKISPLAQEIDGTPFIEAWDTDACNKVTDTLGQAANLAENITSWLFDAGLTFSKKILQLIYCAQEKPDEAIQCALQRIDDIRDAVDSYKPLVRQFKDDIHSLAAELRQDLKKCLSIQKL
uniref:Putative secreted protein n=1 Tax=Panstrongylus lignarius TaxID=156445 RepID=A0A224XUM7_9HEMI